MAAEVCTQIVGQSRGGRVPLRRFLFQTVHADRFEIARSLRHRFSDAIRIAFDDHLHRLHDGVAAERRFASQQFVENDAERIDVG